MIRVSVEYNEMNGLMNNLIGAPGHNPDHPKDDNEISGELLASIHEVHHELLWLQHHKQNNLDKNDIGSGKRD